MSIINFIFIHAYFRFVKKYSFTEKNVCFYILFIMPQTVSRSYYYYFKFSGFICLKKKEISGKEIKKYKKYF